MSEAETGREVAAQVELHGVLPAKTALRGYEIKSVLGQGAFGITYRALDTTLHRDVAIKEYLPTTLALREGRATVLPRSADHVEQFAWGRERFLEEARVLARLDRTSSIIRVFDFLEANGTAYMVMALVEGETLAKRLMREQRLTPEAVERILFPLLDGLEEVHASTFLHRDIKPANIMLDGKGQPTLIDFGASRAAMSDRSTTMTAIFTPGYAAAEQFITSAKLGPWTDIYGLSATLYHAITGRSPPSAVERILNDEYQPLRELQPAGYPPGLLAGIDAGLAVRAPDRPQSIAEWRGMLRSDAASDDGVTRVVPRSVRLARAAGQTSRTGFTIRGPALWGAAVAVVLALAGSGWLAYVASTPAVSTAALNLSAEQLEQALAERRKADAFVAEKKRLEEDAQRKATADAEAKRQADQELEQARQARQKAEAELTQLKADIDARRKIETGQQSQAAASSQRAAEEAAQRKAEAEAAALRAAEDEAQKKAAAEAASMQAANEALLKAQAERQQADQEARQKAEAETAKRQADDDMRQKAEAATKEKSDSEGQKKAGEIAENALRLAPADRQRIQVALTSLGFDTRGTDGVLGARSREMIAGWQQKSGAPATGFMTAAQRDQLLKSAAPAVARWDEEQKKAELATAARAPVQIPSTAAAARPGSPFDGSYVRRTSSVGAGSGAGSAVTMAAVVTNGRGVLTISRAGCNPQEVSITISPAGEVSGSADIGCLLMFTGAGATITGPVSISGKATDQTLDLTFFGNRGSDRIALGRSRN